MSGPDMLGLALLALLGVLLVYLLSRPCGRKKRDGEPPLITGWIPFLGKALEFRKDAYRFLEDHKKKYGNIFTVQIAGKYMTFIMNPSWYPDIIKHGKQLDFHKFSDQAAPVAFGYPPVFSGRFDGMHDKIRSSYRLLRGDNLASLTETMMGNLLLVFRQNHLDERQGGGWRTESMYEFCNSVMFEATFLTLYGKPAQASRRSEMRVLREDFVKFDDKFPLLIAQFPIWLLWGTRTIREKLINYFLPDRMSLWANTSPFIRTRSELFEQYDSLRPIDKAAHHFAILWASVGNTIPATFWAMYYLVTHREALEAVRQELHSVLNLPEEEEVQDRDVTLTKEQLDSLLYLHSAIHESLRLSSASMNIRVVQEDFSLHLRGEGSVAVRKGDIIALYPQSMHMDPKIYEDPETYKYDRYVEDGREKTDFYRNYIMPFGSGSSKCPGRYFAINEIKQFLSLLLLYFEIEVPEGQQKVTLDNGRAGLGILLPANDVRFRYRPRRA